MLYLKEANPEDAEAEWAFLRDMPENENGVENRWHGCSWETFRDIALPRMLAHSRGDNLPEGYVADTTCFLWADGEIVGLFKLRHWLNCASARAISAISSSRTAGAGDTAPRACA